MNHESETSQLRVAVKELEQIAARKKNNALPDLFFFIGLGAGLLLNLASDIIFEIGKEYPGQIFEISILILSFVFVVIIFWYIEKFHLRPIKKLETIIQKLKQLAQ